MSYAPGLDAAFVDKIKSFYDGVRQLLEAALVEGQALGIVGPGDPKMLAAFTIGALKEILFEQEKAPPTRHREALVTNLFAFLERGYLRVAPGEADAAKAAAPLIDADLRRRG
jgi:hypothetical protein